MFDWMEFSRADVEGELEDDVKVLALTTCAFCKKAMDFLEEHNVPYRYAYADQLSREDKRRLTEEYKEHFGDKPLFPTLIINNQSAETGFVKKKWREALGLSEGEE
jgi:glutaredoxin